WSGKRSGVIYAVYGICKSYYGIKIGSVYHKTTIVPPKTGDIDRIGNRSTEFPTGRHVDHDFRSTLATVIYGNGMVARGKAGKHIGRSSGLFKGTQNIGIIGIKRSYGN